MKLKTLCLVATLLLTSRMYAQSPDSDRKIRHHAGCQAHGSDLPQIRGADLSLEPPDESSSGVWDIRWNLSDLQGSRPDTTLSRPVFFILNRAEGRVQGSGHCNQFSGSFTSDGIQTLQFGNLLSTKMACGSLADEQTFFSALGKTAGYRLSEGMLFLVDDKNDILATFNR